MSLGGGAFTTPTSSCDIEASQLFNETISCTRGGGGHGGGGISTLVVTIIDNESKSHSR